MKITLRNLITVIGALATLLSTASDEKQMNILFLGNSFTFRHDLDQLVKQVFEEGQPGLEVNAQRVVYGGSSMYQHSKLFYSQTFIEQQSIDEGTIKDRIRKMEQLLELEQPPNEYLHFWKVIRGKPQAKEFPTGSIQKSIRDHKQLLENNPGIKWNYVVLQSWQDVYPDQNLGYFKYAQYLAEVAREQGAKVVLYITAPDIQNAEPVEAPQLQDRVDTEINVILDLVRKMDPFAVVHVPLAVNKIQQGGTDLTFCYVNDFHPNRYSAFLTSNMFYAAFFKESTEGFKYNTVTETNPKGMGEGNDPDGNAATVVFYKKTKEFLQRMAWQAVMTFDQMP